MLKIGFASSYYTLWEVVEGTRQIDATRRVEFTNYTYIKNISIDKAKVDEKYPNVPFDPDLQGSRESFCKENIIIDWGDNVYTFRFGKYNGRRIDEVNDVKYTAWYYGCIYDEAHKDYVLSFLAPHGYEVIDNNLRTAEEAKEIREDKATRDELVKKAEAGEEMEFLVETNPDYEGDFDFIGYARIAFKYVKECQYKGYPYYLPISGSEDGKACRCKNKRIVATSYEVTWANKKIARIYIKEFKVIK